MSRKRGSTISGSAYRDDVFCAEVAVEKPSQIESTERFPLEVTIRIAPAVAVDEKGKSIEIGIRTAYLRFRSSPDNAVLISQNDRVGDRPLPEHVEAQTRTSKETSRQHQRGLGASLSGNIPTYASSSNLSGRVYGDTEHSVSEQTDMELVQRYDRVKARPGNVWQISALPVEEWLDGRISAYEGDGWCTIDVEEAEFEIIVELYIIRSQNSIHVRPESGGVLSNNKQKALNMLIKQSLSGDKSATEIHILKISAKPEMIQDDENANA